MSFSYFSKLNYTLANEDTALELAIMPDRNRHAVSVCGSGARALTLIANRPARLTLVDLAQEQLWLAQLRLEGLRRLGLAEYRELLGYVSGGQSPARRLEMLRSLELPVEARNFFQGLFENSARAELIYQGKWERAFIKISKLVKRYTGAKGAGIFDCATLEEQAEYFRTRFPQIRWHILIRILGNASFFNALLYRGHFPQKNIPDSFYEFYRNNLDRLFLNGIAAENFFLQLLFFGRIIKEEAFLPEAEPRTFARIKAGLTGCSVEFRRGSILDVLKDMRQDCDFVSLSDVPSYFSGNTERQFMQTIKPGIRDGGLVVIRSYQHVPWRPDLTGYTTVTGNFSEALAAEKTQMYLVDVYRKAD